MNQIDRNFAYLGNRLCFCRFVSIPNTETAVMADCSRGWGRRCAEARDPACNCACNGRNHGTATKLEADRRKARFTGRGGIVATKPICLLCHHFDKRDADGFCQHEMPIASLPGETMPCSCKCKFTEETTDVV